MKKIILHTSISLFLLTVWWSRAVAMEAAKPFGLEIGKASYAEVIKFAETRKWPYREYEKKQFREISKQDPAKGKNTFLKITPEHVKGMRSIYGLFSNEGVLEAVIIALEPNLLETIEGELDQKYDVVKKSLHGEDPAADYPLVQWQKGNVYIELQNPGPYRLRLVYVDKLVYANYKDFLQKTYEPYRHKLEKRNWMNEL